MYSRLLLRAASRATACGAATSRPAASAASAAAAARPSRRAVAAATSTAAPPSRALSLAADKPSAWATSVSSSAGAGGRGGRRVAVAGLNMVGREQSTLTAATTEGAARSMMLLRMFPRMFLLYGVHTAHAYAVVDGLRVPHLLLHHIVQSTAASLCCSGWYPEVNHTTSSIPSLIKRHVLLYSCTTETIYGVVETAPPCTAVASLLSSARHRSCEHVRMYHVTAARLPAAGVAAGCVCCRRRLPVMGTR